MQKNKKKKLVIGTPCGRSLPYEYLVCTLRSFGDLYDKYDIDVSLAESPLLHANRNALMVYADKNDAEYLLFVDSDMIWCPEDIETLIAMNKDVAVGLCFSRKIMLDKGHIPTVMDMDDKGKVTYLENIPDKPFVVGASGSAFMLVRRNVIYSCFNNVQELGYPFDYQPKTFYNKGEQRVTALLGEDISFCLRLKKLGYEIWCNPQVQIGHMTSRVIGLGKNSSIRATRIDP